MPDLRRWRPAGRALLPELQPHPRPRPSWGLLLVPGTAATAEYRSAGARTKLPRSEPQVPSGLLLQRNAAGTPGEPGTLVVPERCLSRAAESGQSHRAPAGDRRPAAGEIGGSYRQGPAGIARGSVRAERGARRDP